LERVETGVRIDEGAALRQDLNVIRAPEKLPKFRKPPVVEVVLGTQFQQLSEMHVAHLGLVWERFRDRFPQVVQQPTLPHAIERKGARASDAMPTISMMSAADQVPRLWMISEDNTELVQLQSDRFMRNWRRYHDQDIEYPTYDEHNRPAFVKDFDAFHRFAEDHGWGALAVDQCEVTYVNHIHTGRVWSEFSQLDRVFRGWSSSYPALAGAPADLISCRVRHEVVDAEGKFVGHLFVEIHSTYSTRPFGAPPSEPLPILQLQLTVRGRPLGEATEGVMRFMDFAHTTIVNSFAEITTPEMHDVWERTQ
jgi:uncharacterized protein (TIGR04255 family)